MGALVPALKFNPIALRRVRNERGLGLRRLASRTGRSPAVISKYELGYCVPSAVALAELAHALTTPMDAFFERVEVAE